MSSKKIILAIQNDETDPPHLAATWLEEIGFHVQVLRADLGESVPTIVPDNVAALMPLGGHMSATDDHVAPWLPAERALLKDAIDRNIPIFAICLGTQLLAIAGGGSVKRFEKSEIGVFDLVPTVAAKDDPIFRDLTNIPATLWHEDYVANLPKGAVTLASTGVCANQIYRIGQLIYGIQCHPEVDISIIAQWEHGADNAYKNSGITSMQPDFIKAESQLAKVWKPIIQNWGRLVSNL